MARLLLIHVVVISSLLLGLGPAAQGAGPSLSLFTPQVNGLAVTINGVATPGTSGATITRIFWDWGDGSSGNQWFPASHTYYGARSYTVTVTSYQSDGLSTTRSVSVTVSGSTPNPPGLSLGTPQVNGLAVTINGAALPGTSGATITRIFWDWGDGVSGNQWFPASHTYRSGSTYTITATCYQSDGLSATKSVTVYVPPQAQPPQAPKSRVMTLQLVPQTSDVSCWAASAAMVIGYYAHMEMSPGVQEKIQQALAEIIDHREYYDTEGMPFDYFYPISREYERAVEQFGPIDLEPVYWGPGGGLTFADVITEIDAGHPMIALWDLGDGGHVVVITGYRYWSGASDGQVFIYDPWPVRQGDTYWLRFQDVPFWWFIPAFRTSRR